MGSGLPPSVKRLLSENPLLNPLSIKPTGKAGRLTKTDILSFLQNPVSQKVISSPISSTSNPRAKKINFNDLPNTNVKNISKSMPHGFMNIEVPFAATTKIVQLFKSGLRRQGKYLVFRNDMYVEDPNDRNLNTLLVTELSARSNLLLTSPYLYHLNIQTISKLVQEPTLTMQKFSFIDFTYDGRVLDPSEAGAILTYVQESIL